MNKQDSEGKKADRDVAKAATPVHPAKVDIKAVHPATTAASKKAHAKRRKSDAKVEKPRTGHNDHNLGIAGGDTSARYAFYHSSALVSTFV